MGDHPDYPHFVGKGHPNFKVESDFKKHYDQLDPTIYQPPSRKNKTRNRRTAALCDLMRQEEAACHGRL
jgi:hypothetical protein